MATFGVYDLDIEELSINIDVGQLLDSLDREEIKELVQRLDEDGVLPNKAINLEAVTNQTWSVNDMVSIIKMFAHRLAGLTDLREIRDDS